MGSCVNALIVLFPTSTVTFHRHITDVLSFRMLPSGLIPASWVGNVMMMQTQALIFTYSAEHGTALLPFLNAANIQYYHLLYLVTGQA